MLSSLEKAVKKENGFWDPKVLDTKQLKDLMSDGDGFKFRENIDFGKRTLWIKANVGDPPLCTWINSFRGPLNNLLLQVTSNNAVGDSRLFLVGYFKLFVKRFEESTNFLVKVGTISDKIFDANVLVNFTIGMILAIKDSLLL